MFVFEGRLRRVTGFEYLCAKYNPSRSNEKVYPVVDRRNTERNLVRRHTRSESQTISEINGLPGARIDAASALRGSADRSEAGVLSEETPEKPAAYRLERIPGSRRSPRISNKLEKLRFPNRNPLNLQRIPTLPKEEFGRPCAPKRLEAAAVNGVLRMCRVIRAL